jgi:tRNA-uridine 2-sulfurtransferase
MIAVAVSGGVDSLMAAHLLRQETSELFAVHFLTGFEPPRAQARHPIHAIGEQLGIAVHVLDVKAEFRTRVVDYFTAAYRSGETPNPCAICNPSIKFGAVLRFAEGLGARGLATGHYAVVRQDPAGRYRLHKGADPRKDQSYFLARLTQDQLARARFPLGALSKDRVRALAAQNGLRPVETTESQDVCFVKSGAYADLVQAAGGAPLEPGPIETVEGRVVGRHTGLARFTIGQRRGLNCPAAAPYYVVRLDPKRNRVVVGAREDLLTRCCRIDHINWISPPPAGPIRVHTRVRYRTPEAPGTLTPLDPVTARVEFDALQSAVTPGQAAVFYEGDAVLGGGFIARER